MKKKKKKRGWLLIAIALVVALFAAGYLKLKQNEDVSYAPTEEEMRDRYHYLLSHVVSTNVHPYLRPVHFSIGTKMAACGTLVLKKDLTPAYIITAAHLFSDTIPGSYYYDYHILGPTGYVASGHVSGVRIDEYRKSNTVMGIQDLVICDIGEPSLIARTSKVAVSAARAMQAKFTVTKPESDIFVTYLTTGAVYRLIGECHPVPGEAGYYILQYSAVNGESGGGFLGSDGNLYVLSGTAPVTKQLRKDLDIPDDMQTVTMLSAVKLEW